MEIRQSQKQTQQLMLTQAMRQSLHILQMPLLELREYVTEAAAENPLLEVDCPEGEVALEPEPEEAFEPDNPHNPEDFFLSAEHWSAGGTRRRAEEGTSLDAGALADHSAREEKLSDVLNEQLLGLSLPEDTVEICRYLIDCLNGDGYLDFPIEELAREMGFLPVENSRPDLGLSRTIALGMAHMQDMDAVLFQVSDQPLLRRDSVEQLVEVYRSHPDRLVALGHDGVRGNPCLFPAGLFPELLALEGDHGGSAVIRRHEDRLLLVEASPRELTDVDTPQALEVLTGEKTV